MSKQNDRDSIVDLLKQYLGLEANDTERFEAIADELCGVFVQARMEAGSNKAGQSSVRIPDSSS